MLTCAYSACTLLSTIELVLRTIRILNAKEAKYTQDRKVFGLG